ncbi:LysR family transcriptional regulator [Microbulbifer hainanensis]|uniref:LysR family transcriptional regulator n=1 Tax=Microbulbifer hainanensis TaxID=2735675 RepID=UPI001865E3AF|nr:LysR family transcriptional regulator [Microbulbifer hainanensis]
MSRASLAELEAVVTVARCGGFRAAARELDVSSSALSHAVSALEERIGVRLFNRSTRSVALTAAGEQFVTDIAPVLATIDDAIENVGEHRAEPSGVLRLNMALGAARMLLKPLILEYMRRYPAMQVEIVTEGMLVDVIGQGFDAGVRLVESVPPDMIAVPIIPTVRSIVAGAPSYLNGRTLPETPHDLMQHQCIRARMASGRLYQWEFERHGESLSIDVPGVLTLDDSELMLEAAVDGAGLAYITEHSAATYLQEGRLVRVLDDWTPPYAGLCLYYSGRKHVPAKLRAFIELIRETKIWT